jgi:hypothetical protein
MVRDSRPTLVEATASRILNQPQEQREFQTVSIGRSLWSPESNMLPILLTPSSRIYITPIMVPLGYMVMPRSSAYHPSYLYGTSFHLQSVSSHTQFIVVGDLHNGKWDTAWMALSISLHILVVVCIRSLICGKPGVAGFKAWSGLASISMSVLNILELLCVVQLQSGSTILD